MIWVMVIVVKLESKKILFFKILLQNVVTKPFVRRIAGYSRRQLPVSNLRVVLVPQAFGRMGRGAVAAVVPERRCGLA